MPSPENVSLPEGREFYGYELSDCKDRLVAHRNKTRSGLARCSTGGRRDTTVPAVPERPFGPHGLRRPRSTASRAESPAHAGVGSSVRHTAIPAYDKGQSHTYPHLRRPPSNTPDGQSDANGMIPGEREVSIDLTPSQVTEIFHNTVAVPGWSSSRAGPPIRLRSGGSRSSIHDLYYDRKSSRSVFHGLTVLCVFADCGKHRTGDIAAKVGFSRVYGLPHVRTLGGACMLEVDAVSGLYRLIPPLSGRLLGTSDSSSKVTK